MIAKAAYEQYLSLDSIKAMGWMNILWVVLVAFLFLAARAKKIGVTSIGKNEWGMLEILGFPLVPIPFGLWPFVKGIFHVKQVSTAPVRVTLVARQVVEKRVLLVDITVHVRVAQRRRDATSLRSWFVQLRRDLVAALYGVLDESVDDAENPERINQTRDVLENAKREILKSATTVDTVTVESLISRCGAILQSRFGEYIESVFIREDAPTDGQLWKEGRQPDPINTGRGIDDELPPGLVGSERPNLEVITGGSAPEADAQ